MQINLEQRDIEVALKSHLSASGIQTSDKYITMAFKNGRKSAGLTVSINIQDKTEVVAVAPPLRDTSDDGDGVDLAVGITSEPEPEEEQEKPKSLFSN